MSASHRTHRALVFEYADIGASGTMDSVYLVRASADADQRWWCSRGEEGGSELTVGSKPEQRNSAVFGFHTEVPVSVNDAFICDGETFVVRSIDPRTYGIAERHAHAERVSNLQLTST